MKKKKNKRMSIDINGTMRERSRRTRMKRSQRL
jgi:hypothetical protein